MKMKAWIKTLAMWVALMMITCMGLSAFAEETNGALTEIPEIVEVIEEEEVIIEEEVISETKDESESKTTAPSETVVTTPAAEQKTGNVADTTDVTETENKTEEKKEEIQEPVFYDVTFSVDGITRVISSQEGKPIEKPIAPAKEGFLFTHWYVDGGNDATAFNFNVPLLGKLTLVAFFEEVVVVDDNNTDTNEPEVNTENNNINEDTRTIITTLENNLGIIINIVDDEEKKDLADDVEENDEDVIDDEDALSGEEDELDGELFELDDYDTPLAGPGQSVNVWMTVPGAMAYYGDTVTLHSELIGYDGQNVTLQWFCNGQPVQGANGAQHTFELTKESETWIWQLEANVVQ